MRKRVARLSLVLGLVIALVAIPGTAAQGESGTQRFRIIENPSTQPGGRIVGTGTFSGVGTTIVHYFDISPDGSSFQGSDTFVFDEGTLTVEFQGFFTDFRLQPRSCVAHSQGTTTQFSVVSGTGVFEGATGSLASTDRAIVWFERGPDGCTFEVSRYNAFIDITGTLELAQAS